MTAWVVWAAIKKKWHCLHGRNNTILFSHSSEVGKFRIKIWQGSFSVENSLPGLEMAASLLSSHGGVWASSVSSFCSYMAPALKHEVPTHMTDLTFIISSLALFSKIVTLATRAPTYESWGYRNIQFVTTIYYKVFMILVHLISTISHKSIHFLHSSYTWFSTSFWNTHSFSSLSSFS